MFKNYMKSAFRRLLKSWSFSAVNMFGLATGITTCFLVFFYVHFETTYDKSIPEAKDKYRVALRISGEESTWEFAQLAAPAAVAFENRFPQVEETVRFASLSGIKVTYQDHVHQEDQILFSDPTFIPFFGLKLLQGNPETALSQPGTLLVTETMGQKYFGNENPMGKSVEIDNRHYEVTGIIPDATTNSHIPYRFIASFDRFEEDQEFVQSKWTKNMFYTYVELTGGNDPRIFEEQIQSLANQLDEPGWDYAYFLQRISDIHLHSDLGGELKPPGDATNLLIFSIIGSFVFFIACFNFVNLSTARSIKRATEVGIRKVVGATRLQLVLQFMSESVLVILVALILAVGITVLIFPTYRNLVGIAFEGRDILKPVYPVFLGVLALTAGLGAGSYPAFFMARFDPEKIIKGVMPSGVKVVGVRKALITLQFVVAILLMICTLFINKQISFMKDQENFGFETEKRLILRVGATKFSGLSGERALALKEEFAKHSSIEQAVVSTTVPGRGMVQQSMRKQDEDWSHKRQINYLGVDYDFLPQYGIELAAGRMLERNRPSDGSGAFLINETAARELGWASPEDALNEEIVVGNDQNVHRIVGVVKDFHYMGMQSPIEPLILQHLLASNPPIGYFTLTVKTSDMNETVQFVRNTWADIFPEYPFEYFFLDQDFKRLYEKEERLRQMIGLLTYLGIFITCLGLWGLSSLGTEQRIKEIGIRKILGASVAGVILLLSKEFTKWVLAANIIAWPIGYFVMRNWLRNFAYRTRVTPEIFILSALFALAIALITVTLQTRRAAQANPVESLRYE
jgi:putative ABC transport system permease protein